MSKVNTQLKCAGVKKKGKKEWKIIYKKKGYLLMKNLNRKDKKQRKNLKIQSNQ